MERWRITTETNGNARKIIARDLDDLVARVMEIPVSQVGDLRAKRGIVLKALGEFGDFLLDTDIRYGEVEDA